MTRYANPYVYVDYGESPLDRQILSEDYHAHQERIAPVPESSHEEDMGGEESCTYT